jgi:ketosteroid isomerase-like protein
MTRKLNRVALTLVIVAGTLLSASAQNAKHADVVAALRKYDDAWNKKDVATVDRLLAPEYVYFSSTGNLTSRQQTLELLKSPGYKLTFAERTEVKTFRSGATVIVSSRWKGKGTYNDEEINDDQRCSLVFAKQKNSWQLLSEHCTQIVRK